MEFDHHQENFTESAPEAARSVDTAIIYAGRYGLPVFPTRGKQPLVKWGTEATLDPKTIRSWWQRWPRAGIATLTGKVSGIIVLDIDVKNGRNGFHTLADDFAIYDSPPIPTPQVFTPSSGLHLYFAADPDREIRSSVEQIGVGLDIRGEGSCVTLPSPGSNYAWHSKLNFETVAPLPFPPELLPRKVERKAHEPIEDCDGLSPYAKAALDSACRNITAAANGKQEATLHAECFSIGTLAGAGGIPERFALKTLLWAASRMPDFNHGVTGRFVQNSTLTRGSFGDCLSDGF